MHVASVAALPVALQCHVLQGIQYSAAVMHMTYLGGVAVNILHAVSLSVLTCQVSVRSCCARPLLLSCTRSTSVVERWMMRLQR